jgi:hypothetical protein
MALSLVSADSDPWFSSESAGCARAMLRAAASCNERFTQITTLRDRLALEAERLRHQAHTFPAGKNATLLRKAHQIDTASQTDEWRSSPGL